MPLKLAANISMLFKEAGGLTERLHAAKAAGFQAAECAFPYDESVENLVAAKVATGMEFVLINSNPGKISQGEFGYAALTYKCKEFRESLEKSILYAKALNCKRMHVMAGVNPKFTDKAMPECYVDSLKYAAERLQKEGILCLIEFLNPYSTPNYFLNNLHDAIKYIKQADHPNLKLQMDIFHLQMTNGGITNNFKKLLPLIGHVQVAQAPNRDEPDSAGEINYKYVFDLLRESNYEGYVGLEYMPRGKTLDGLGFIKEYGLSL